MAAALAHNYEVKMSTNARENVSELRKNGPRCQEEKFRLINYDSLLSRGLLYSLLKAQTELFAH